MKREDILALMNQIDDQLLIDCETRINNLTVRKKYLLKPVALIASVGAAVIILTVSMLKLGGTPSVGPIATEKTDTTASTSTTALQIPDPDIPPASSWALESYESLAGFWNDFGKTGDKDKENYEKFGSDFKTLVEKIQTQKYLLIPAIEGNPAPLKLDDEYLDIMVATSNELNRPWVWYGCAVGGKEITVKTTYLWDSQAQASKEMTASAFLEAFYPEAPNLGTQNNYKDRTIYETEMNYNGKMINALFVEYNLDNKMEVYWLTDGLLVCVYTDKDGLETGWTERLSFIEMPLTNE